MPEPMTYLNPSARASWPLRVLIGVSFLLSLGALAASGYLFLLLKTERAKVGVIEASKIQLSERIEALQKENESMAVARQVSQDKLKEVLKDLLEREKTFALITQDFDTLKNENVSANKKILEMQESVEKARELVKTAAAKKMTPRPKAPNIVLAGDSPAVKPQMISPPAMKIKTINRDLDFVVLSVHGGSLTAGDRLVSESEGEWSADLSVTEIYKGFAKAQMVKSSEVGPLIGDKVRSADA